MRKHCVEEADLRANEASQQGYSSRQLYLKEEGRRWDSDVPPNITRAARGPEGIPRPRCGMPPKKRQPVLEQVPASRARPRSLGAGPGAQKTGPGLARKKKEMAGPGPI